MRLDRLRDYVITVILLLILCAQLQSLLSSPLVADAVEREEVVVLGPPRDENSASPVARQRDAPAVKTEPPALTHPPASSSLFTFTFGTNPQPRCGGVQPNTTDIDPYKGCPLPGLNNLLFTQVNRWFCAVRDNRALHLRDRSCNKGSEEPFRFSTIVQVDYEGLARELPGRDNAAICWSDISRQDKAASCEWGDIPKFYGSDLWWKVRRLIDFHVTYYDSAKRFVDLTFENRPYLAVHLRRGDYWQHCVVIKRKGVPPWESFRHVRKLYDYEKGCYPSLDLVYDTLKDVAKRHYGLKDIFIATNTVDEFLPLVRKLADHDGIQLVVGVPRTFYQSLSSGSGRPLRKLDELIIEMAVLSYGATFLFNRYSSLSGMAYEMAVVHGRAAVNGPTVACW